MSLRGVPVADGEWHRIEVLWTVAGVTLSMDYGLRSVTRSLSAKLQGLYVGKIVIGGNEDQADTNTGFNGCIQVHHNIISFDENYVVHNCSPLCFS